MSEAIVNDLVEHPSHYTQGQWEVIDVIEGMNMTDFREANILKYLFRYKYKGKPKEDLEKCAWYLNRLITIVKKQQSDATRDMYRGKSQSMREQNAGL